MTIKELASKYNLNKNDVWQCQNAWVIKHDAIERIAVTEGVIFDTPQVVEFNGSLGLIGRATKDGKNYIWSTGEASNENVKGKGRYYFAMAEKRLKDRLTLKLINAYQYGIYSEDEADDFERRQK
jgi:hypothetical protein